MTATTTRLISIQDARRTARAGFGRHLPRLGAVLTLLWVSVGCRTAINPKLIEDPQTTVRIRTALVNDPQLGLRGIEVHVTAGVARLTGFVDSADEAQRLISLVRAIHGVLSVQSDVQVSGTQTPVSPPPGRPQGVRSEEPEGPSDPRLLAIGGAASWTIPFVKNLSTGVSGGPLLRFGSGTGLSPAVDFNWFAVDLFAGGDQTARLARMSVKPVMGGVGYTWGNERVALDLSVVAGYSFNRLETDDLAAGKILALRVDSSFAWRPGINIWYDASTRFAINVFAGYVITRPTVAFFEDGQIVKRDQRADTLLVSTGLAYKLF